MEDGEWGMTRHKWLEALGAIMKPKAKPRHSAACETKHLQRARMEHDLPSQTSGWLNYGAMKLHKEQS